MKKRMTCCILALCLLLFGLAGCSADRGQTEEFRGMGTSVSVTLYGKEQAIKNGFEPQKPYSDRMEGFFLYKDNN